jgi:site-specific recombinase XerD
MNIQHFFNDRTEIRTYRALTKAPLAPWIDRYAGHLREEGYSKQGSCEQLRMLARFNEWLDMQSFTADTVTPDAFEGFRDHLQRKGKLRGGYETALQHLLRIMHPNLCVETPTRLDLLLQGFGDYQLNDRGLAKTSVRDWRRHVQNFLEKQVPGGDPGDLSQIQPHLISNWIQREANRTSAAYGRHIATALRSFFSYTFYKGLMDRNLATCVPSVRTWSLTEIPRYLSVEQVQKVLDGCDRTRRTGKRDFAILLLLARLGLRAGEVIGLQLDDIDWNEGLITVHGKTRRASRMPLPQEVGEALANYLYSSRPRCKARHIFIRSRAPHRPFTEVGAISAIATRALKNAGVAVGLNGAHVFRHSLATTMLKNGASLGEIGEILRHRRADTTRIYAKVDIASLRKLALAWPGGSR